MAKAASSQMRRGLSFQSLLFYDCTLIQDGHCWVLALAAFLCRGIVPTLCIEIQIWPEAWI